MVEFCIVHLGVTEYRISSGVEADHSMDGGGLHQTVFLSWKREPICRPTRNLFHRQFPGTAVLRNVRCHRCVVAECDMSSLSSLPSFSDISESVLNGAAKVTVIFD